MGVKLRLTFLVEDSVTRPGLRAEHGLSVLIEHGGRRFLFDTGQSDLLLQNARALGLPLENVEAAVLSHGHYDHTGGLPSLLSALGGLKVFAHPAALEKKYYLAPGAPPREIGLPMERARLEAACELVLSASPQPVAPGLLTTGEISARHPFEAIGEPFFKDAAGGQRDGLPDDQSLIIEAPGGPVLLAGCAHAGIVATMEHAGRMLATGHLQAVIGGLHLLEASQERIERTVEAFRRFGVARIGLAHCTGIEATLALWRAFPGRCFLCPVGTVVEF